MHSFCNNASAILLRRGSLREVREAMRGYRLGRGPRAAFVKDRSKNVTVAGRGLCAAASPLSNDGLDGKQTVSCDKREEATGRVTPIQLRTYLHLCFKLYFK